MFEDSERVSLPLFLNLIKDAHLLSFLAVPFGNPFACFDHLEDINVLLE
jgi:hypothetical protein